MNYNNEQTPKGRKATLTALPQGKRLVYVVAVMTTVYVMAENNEEMDTDAVLDAAMELDLSGREFDYEVINKGVVCIQ